MLSESFKMGQKKKLKTPSDTKGSKKMKLDPNISEKKENEKDKKKNMESQSLDDFLQVR